VVGSLCIGVKFVVFPAYLLHALQVHKVYYSPSALSSFEKQEVFIQLAQSSKILKWMMAMQQIPKMAVTLLFFRACVSALTLWHLGEFGDF